MYQIRKMALAADKSSDGSIDAVFEVNWRFVVTANFEKSDIATMDEDNLRAVLGGLVDEMVGMTKNIGEAIEIGGLIDVRDGSTGESIKTMYLVATEKAEGPGAQELKPYRVKLNEEEGDKFTMVFDCMAEDADHAAEQAENAYPGCTIINCTEFEGDLPLNSWLRNLRPGDEVWWSDPDHHKSSGIYTVLFVNGGEVLFNDSILMLKNEAGSEAEVFARELAPIQPQDIFPVVDGDDGNGDIYGYATSKEEAIEVGNETFADRVWDAYLTDAQITLCDGSIVPQAWVALTTLDNRYADSIIGGRHEDYDALEIHGVRDLQETGDENGTCCEVDDQDPEFFSVYVHCKAGGVECVGDFSEHEAAIRYAAELSERHGWPKHDYVGTRQS